MKYRQARKLLTTFGVTLMLALSVTAAPDAFAEPGPTARLSPSTQPTSGTLTPAPTETPPPTSSAPPAPGSSVSADPSPQPSKLTPAKRRELGRLWKQWGCTIPKNAGNHMIGCFRQVPYQPGPAPRASDPDPTMPNCPVPSHRDKIHYTRTYSCSHVTEIGIFYRSRTNPEIVGSAKSNVAFQEWLSPASRQWQRVVYYQNQYVLGELNPDLLTATFEIGCTNGGCGTPTKAVFTAKRGVIQSHTQDMESAGSQIAFPNPQTLVTYEYPGAYLKEDMPLHVGPPTGIRCDSKENVTRSRKPGCVYHWYTPVYEVDYTGPMPTIAQNILFGQLGLRSHPGFPGNNTTPGGQPLVRGPAQIKDPRTGELTDFSDISRAVACPGSIPKPPGMTCDEYPFASTWNGAYWVKADDWTCRLVPAAENSYQSNDIQKFTDDNRLWRNPDGKTAHTTGSRKQGSFWVAVTNAPSTPPTFNQCQKHL